MEQLTQDQIQAIKSLSFEAEAFLNSNLCEKLKQSLEATKTDIVDRFFNNKRLENEKDLTRDQFAERLSGQYQSVYLSIAIIMQFAQQAKELEKMKVEKPEVKDVRPSEGKHPSHGQ